MFCNVTSTGSRHALIGFCHGLYLSLYFQHTGLEASIMYTGELNATNITKSPREPDSGLSPSTKAVAHVSKYIDVAYSGPTDNVRARRRKRGGQEWGKNRRLVKKIEVETRKIGRTNKKGEQEDCKMNPSHPARQTEPLKPRQQSIADPCKASRLEQSRQYPPGANPLRACSGYTA